MAIRGRGIHKAAERTARQLSGQGPTSHDARTPAMLVAAQGLAPATGLSADAKQRIRDAAKRELRRQFAEEQAATPVQEPADLPALWHLDGAGDMTPHTARVRTTDGITVVAADALEEIGPERARLVAEQASDIIAAVRARKASAEEAH